MAQNVTGDGGGAAEGWGHLGRLRSGCNRPIADTRSWLQLLPPNASFGGYRQRCWPLKLGHPFSQPWIDFGIRLLQTLEGDYMSVAGPRVDWFFGRGLSIGCGLPWSVLPDWLQLPRNEQIARIKTALSAEMNGSTIDCSDIHQLLRMLSKNTVTPWRHLFLTTNWDYLLQREVLAQGHKVQPAWLAETHVYHLNGTVEDLPNNQNRSPFLLETDPSDQRTSSIEASCAFNKIIWNKTFVVVGMSFECEADKFLLRSLARVQDDLPIGESEWIIVNRDITAITKLAERIRHALPHSTIHSVPVTFRSWLDAKAPELQARGALAF